MVYLAVLFGLLFALMLVGVPIGFCLGISAVVVLVVGLHVPGSLVALKMVGSVNTWSWAALPLFIILGQLMTTTGITKRLVDLSMTLVGHIRGGLSHVSVLTNTLLAGMSGSLTADAAAVGAIFGPSMQKAGYGRGYTAAIVAAGACIGPMIPPSISFILVGTVGEISILKLFMGGVIPGLLVAISLIGTGYVVARVRKYPAEPKATWSQRRTEFVGAVPALVLPVVIIGGMRAGWFTATEAGAVGIVYAVIIGTLFYRETKWRDVWDTFVDTAVASGKTFLIIAVSGMFSWALTMLNASQLIMDALAPFMSPLPFLLLVVVVFTILGCIIDGVVLILIFVPLLVPIVLELGIDPVQFGVVFAITNIIGSVTPPLAVGMFMSCAVTGASVGEYIKEGGILLVPLFVVNLLLVFIPQCTTWLPALVGGG